MNQGNDQGGKTSDNATPIEMHDLIDMVITTLDARDPQTYAHSIRVAELSVMIAENMNLSSTTIDSIHTAAHLHDIGKIGVPDKVLNKVGQLDVMDWNHMQAHPRIGYNILEKLPLFKPISKIVLYHHERFDGLGYPTGLRGEEIPLESRIIAVADAFDAITSDRPYRKGADYQVGFEEINRHVFDQFCPRIVKHFNAIRALVPEALNKADDVILQPMAFVGHNDLRHSRRQS